MNSCDTQYPAPEIPIRHRSGWELDLMARTLYKLRPGFLFKADFLSSREKRVALSLIGRPTRFFYKGFCFSFDFLPPTTSEPVVTLPSCANSEGLKVESTLENAERLAMNAIEISKLFSNPGIWPHTGPWPPPRTRRGRLFETSPSWFAKWMPEHGSMRGTFSLSRNCSGSGGDQTIQSNIGLPFILFAKNPPWSQQNSDFAVFQLGSYYLQRLPISPMCLVRIYFLTCWLVMAYFQASFSLFPNINRYEQSYMQGLLFGECFLPFLGLSRDNVLVFLP